jgi:hypothetical protein
MVLSKINVEAIWLKKLLRELGFFQITPTIVFLIIKVLVPLNINPKCHSCSKHAGTWCHFTKN